MVTYKKLGLKMRRSGNSWAVYNSAGGVLYSGSGNKGQIMSECLKTIAVFEHKTWRLNDKS